MAPAVLGISSSIWSGLGTYVQGRDHRAPIDVDGVHLEGIRVTYDPTMPVYLRIGDWDGDETSRNHAEGDAECGVSVYDLARDGGIVVPPDGEWSHRDLLQRLRSGATCHLVQGEWVGNGGEGEACLKSLVVIGVWPDDLPSGFRGSVEVDAFDTVVAIEAAIELNIPGSVMRR